MIATHLYGWGYAFKNTKAIVCKKQWPLMVENLLFDLVVSSIIL